MLSEKLPEKGLVGCAGSKGGGVSGGGIAVWLGLPYAELENNACAGQFGAEGGLSVGLVKAGFGVGHLGFWLCGSLHIRFQAA
ncbi:hypothetical protein BP50_000806 [Kingella potus DSM 18304]